MKERTVIVGGGAMGSATAWFLAQLEGSGANVVVVERDPSYQFASSSLSASSIRQQFSTPLSIELSQFGFEFMRSCSDDGIPGSAVGLRESGYLFLGRQDQALALAERTRIALERGARIREYDRHSLAASYPWLCLDDVVYACQGELGEGWFDGYLLQQLFRSRARRVGVEYLQGDVVDLDVKGARVAAVILKDGSLLPAKRVVNAAGPWSARVASMAGVDLPVRARRRTMFVVSCPTAFAGFPILIDTTGVFVRPEQNHFLCTVSPQEQIDHDDLPLDPDFTLFEETIWPTLAHRIPAFESLRVERAWAGYYEYNTEDQNGLVGQVGPENFFVATGFSGHGLMHSAGIGRAMAELLTYGAFRSLDLAPLSPGRLRSRELLIEDAVY
ncbi:MAG: FAD-binding oxidoreductase [Burkholderiaceae bacterium]